MTSPRLDADLVERAAETVGRRVETLGVSYRSRPELVSAPLSEAGETLLHAAAEWDAPEVAAVALARGADTTIRDRVHNGTPLGWAKHFGRARIAEMLR